MEILILLPALLVFLYSLYRLVKDDYVFIRKGISLEQAFDITFICIWISLFFSRLFSLLFNYKIGENIFLKLFSFHEGDLSLTGGIIGGMISLYLIGKYKRVPLGRLGDFLSLSLLFALPFGFLANTLLVKKEQLLFILLNTVLFFLLMMFFLQFLYPKLMSRELKEGTVAILFLLFFSIVSLLTVIVSSLKAIHTIINSHTITLLILLLFSIALFVKEGHPFSRQRRTLSR